MRAALAWTGTALFSFFVPAVVGGVVAWWLPHGPWPPTAAWRWSGVLPVTLGAAAYGWCALDFARHGGTPAPVAETDELVVTGPYRWVRNPMYVAVLTAVSGWAALLASWWIAAYGVVVGLVMHAFVVAYEEPRLHRRFGRAYDAFRERTPRWTPRRPERRAR